VRARARARVRAAARANTRARAKARAKVMLFGRESDRSRQHKKTQSQAHDHRQNTKHTHSNQKKNCNQIFVFEPSDQECIQIEHICSNIFKCKRTPYIRAHIEKYTYMDTDTFISVADTIVHNSFSSCTRVSIRIF